MQRRGFLPIALTLATALCICPVIAKAAPRAAAIQRPAKVRRLISDGARDESPQRELAASPDLDVPALFFIVVKERVRSFAMIGDFISLCERTAGSLCRNNQKVLGSSTRDFCGGIRPLRC
jgi:hypothetical protein